MIDLVYKTLLTILNKENQGYVSPTEFNVIANNVQMEIFRGYFEDINADQVKENRGYSNKRYANLTFIGRQKMAELAEIAPIIKEAGRFRLPNDLYFIEDDGVTVRTFSTDGSIKVVNKEAGEVVEEVERGVLGYLNRSISKPSEAYPVYERYDKHLIISPSTVESVNIRYIRKPKAPQWTYFVLPDGTEVFNPASNTFQDFELHESEFSNIVTRMLTYFGITLREGLVIEIAEMLKNKTITKEVQ